MNGKDIRSTIEDIGSVRFSKINKILDNIGPEHVILNLNNITSKELEIIRPFITQAFNGKLEILTSGSEIPNFINTAFNNFI